MALSVDDQRQLDYLTAVGKDMNPAQQTQFQQLQAKAAADPSTPQGQTAVQQAATQNYQAGIGSAVTTLQGAGTSLDAQYNDLLGKVLGVGTVAMNTVTTGENNLLASRGITNNSPLYASQMGSAQLPVMSQIQGNIGSLGYTQAQLKNTLAQNIAGIQAGGAGTLAGFPLSFGSLALAQAANVANIALAGSQAANYPTAQQALANQLAIAQLGYYRPFGVGNLVYQPGSVGGTSGFIMPVK